MSDALIIGIAEAVKDALNAASLSQSFTATRGYAPRTDLEALSTLHVTVVPRGMDAFGPGVGQSTRGMKERSYQVDVAVQIKPADIEPATLDPYMLLAEEIGDLFIGARMGTSPDVHCLAAENTPIYAPEHLREKRVFTSVMTLTFKTWR